jgi:WD40 repeat protein
MNSLKLGRRSGRWNRVDTFQISRPTTKSAVQNNKLFNVEFTRETLQKLDRPSDLPKCQDYHGLRSVRYPKRPINFVTGHPHNPVFVVNHDRNAIACSARHFSIDQEVLQLLPTAEAERAEAVAWTTIPDGQRRHLRSTGDHSHGPIARDCTEHFGARRHGHLSGHNASRLDYSCFSRNWQWVAEALGLTASCPVSCSFC